MATAKIPGSAVEHYQKGGTEVPYAAADATAMVLTKPLLAPKSQILAQYYPSGDSEGS